MQKLAIANKPNVDSHYKKSNRKQKNIEKMGRWGEQVDNNVKKVKLTIF